ncbi:MAG: CBS domain-containing protein [Candidatus Aenigmatarchaeota archaeon]
MKVDEIKILRKSMDLTQSDLAKLSGVSQSLIARIESGKVDTSFSKVEKIFDALEKSKNNKTKLTAKDFMKKSVMKIHPNESITKAAVIMKRRNISQLPVIDNNNVIGTISEKEISHSILRNPKKLLVKDIMSDSLPLVSVNTTVEVLADLLDYYPSVLVAENGKIKGIVCRSDLMKLIRNK